MPLEPLGADFYAGLQRRLAAAAAEADAEAILLLETESVVWASGFFHSANERPVGLLVPAAGDPVLFVPHLEQENAEGIVADMRTYDEFPGHEHPVLWMARQAGVRRLAVDTLEARIAEALAARLDRLVLSDAPTRLRAVKSEAELVFVRAAASYADTVLEAVLAEAGGIIAGGGTERDILAAGLSAAQRRMAAELGDLPDRTRCGLTGTVHSGPRAALPHGRTMARTPLAGETLIAGIGASVAGYHAESGATFVVGEPDGDTLDCLRAAEACDAAAQAALRPGVRCEAVNEAALAVLREAGFGEAIRHRIGHGMGIAGHEAPWLAPGDPTVVEAGMVFSSEPGIYRPGRDGTRTINTLIVGMDAPEVPSLFQSDHPIEARILAPNA